MITTAIYNFIDIPNLEFYLDNNIANSPQLLIQIFFNTSDENYISNIQKTLHANLPDAHIIGTTTDGSIHNAQKDTDKTVISFTHFEKSQLAHKLFFLSSSKEQECAKEICESLLFENTKVIILFTEALHHDIELLIKEIHQHAPRVILAGGLAGDNGRLQKTFVCDNTKYTDRGVVAVSINSDSLFVHNDFNLSWEAVGKGMTITKCNGNIVHEIDGINPIQRYKDFLGSHTFKKYKHDFLPTVGIEFPFILERDGFLVARVALNRNKNSIIFTGNFQEGDKLHFSFANIEKIRNSGSLLAKNIHNKPVETIFVYSCMARRRFMQENIIHDLEPLSKIAPVSGFYTYGEIYTTPKTKECLNHTMTLLALSEEQENRCSFQFYENKIQDENFETLAALTKLLQVSSAQEEGRLLLSKDLYWDSKQLQLSYQDKIIPLSRSKILLLDLLIQHKNHAVDAYTIFSYIWGENSKEFNADSVRTLIKKLRKKLPVNLIQNSYGGYYKLTINPS